MHGAAGRAIQELVGHRDLTLAQRYMPLSPEALDWNDSAPGAVEYAASGWRPIGDDGRFCYRPSTSCSRRTR